MSIDFDVLLQELAKQRPIFHSEKDFQYEVGWAMRSHGVKEYSQFNALMGQNTSRQQRLHWVQFRSLRSAGT